MKYISLLLTAAMLGVSCSSTPENKAPNSNARSTTTSPTPVAVTPATPATASSVIPTAPIVSDGKNPLPEVAGTPVPTPDPNQQTLGGDAQKRKQLADQPISGPPPNSKPVPAGENSMVTTSMDRLGRFVETRVFNGHSQLVKAERVWVDVNGSVLTLTLKNGKQIRGSGASIPNMMAATAVDLMLAVGMKLPEPDPNATGSRQ